MLMARVANIVNEKRSTQLGLNQGFSVEFVRFVNDREEEFERYISELKKNLPSFRLNRNHQTEEDASRIVP